MRMEEPGPHAVGDVVLYRSDADGRLIRGVVAAVRVVHSYDVIPQGTLGIVDTVEEALF